MLLLICSTPVWAQELKDDKQPPPDPDARVHVAQIELQGLRCTEEFVVFNQLPFAAGAQVFIHEIEEGVRRLRNLAIFDRVEYRLEPALDPLDADADADAAIERELVITLVERWTILPILNFNFGGNATSFSLGVYDLNIAGRNFELGGLYRYEAGAHSAGAWYRSPSFLGQRLMRFEFELWRASVRRLIYALDGELAGGFEHRSHYALVRLAQEWTPSARTSVALRFTIDDFSLNGVPATARQAQQGQGLPQSTALAIVVLGAELGRLDQDSFLVFGQRLSLSLDVASSGFGAPQSYLSPRLNLEFFRTLPLESTFGARMTLATTNTDSQAYQFYLGGLNNVRGYGNSRFHGRSFWNANVELRVPSFNNRYFVLQHVLFADSTRVIDAPRDLFDITAASAGIGLRLIVPRVAGLLIRLDYAWTFFVPGEANFNVGSGQFF
ncbi:MAG: BamA/TamA family outer membrane protein [Bradymonadaceae bacterium]|nr:BamA/TamA family outer membrane protein [Lujinxingiaceae bacterium]